MSCLHLAVALSLFSHHIHVEHHYNEVNPGASIICDNTEVGAYHNSINHTSVFVDYRTKSFMYGLVSGYFGGVVVPQVAWYHDFPNHVETIAMLFPVLTPKNHVRNVGAVIGFRYKFQLY